MFGWFRPPAVCASCSNRRSRSASLENVAGSTLMAPSRLSRESRAPASRWMERVRPTGDRGSAFDGAKAVASLKAILPGAPEALPWPDSFDAAGRRAVYVIGDGLFLLDLPSSTLERIGRAEDK